MVRVKICGITNAEDALWAADSGADALGFVFAESRRRVSSEQAAAIRRQLPPFIFAVGIFVNPEPVRTREIFETVGLDFIQLYGGDEKRFLRGAGLSPSRLIRAIPVSSEADLTAIGESSAGIILLDTKVDGTPGGSGKTFDWSIAAKATALGRPIVLSGGLNPDNVQAAIRLASPQAVDVSSGVESAPGKKNPEKVREFIRRAKEYVA